MADIDFDELDKAVNDLMANVDATKRPAGLDEPEQKVVTIPTSDATPATPSTSAAPAPVSPAAPAAPETPSAAPAPAPTSPSLAVKRRGQFMDIVHPSRDMNTAKPVSRQGATIQPGNDVIAPSTAPQPQQSTAPAPVDEPAATATPEKPQQSASPWPDPIDMANNASTPAVTAVPEAPVDAATEAPLTSPFLPDAKPEKRPLGNLMQAEEAAQDAPESAKDELQTPATPEATAAAVLPEEFSGDLMAVESRDLSSHPEQPAAVPTPAEQPKLESGEVESLIPAVATPDVVEQQPQVAPLTPAQPPAGGSIAQQYTEQPSSGDQSNGSIYDTATYHQPIEPVAPVKKKTPTSVWIMIGIGLLLVGAIAGAAYFYFTR